MLSLLEVALAALTIGLMWVGPCKDSEILASTLVAVSGLSKSPASIVFFLFFSDFKMSLHCSFRLSLCIVLSPLGILYGLLPMVFHRDVIDPCFWPAASAILSGFTLFQWDPLGPVAR